MTIRKLLSCVLALCLVLSLFTPAAGAVTAAPVDGYTQEGQTRENNKENSLLASGWKGTPTLRDESNAPAGSWSIQEKENDYRVNLFGSASTAMEELREASALYHRDEIVAAFIVMEELPLVERYANIGAVPTAETNRLVSGQDAVISAIEHTVLKGDRLNVRYQFTYLTNAISVRTAFGNLESIARVPGVKSVYLVPQYEVCTTQGNTASPMNFAAGDNTGVHQVWEKLGYTGTGMTVAVIDTGLDLDHPSFAAAPELNESSMTQKDVEQVLARLNASEIKAGLKASQLYRSEKVPYAFNYVDGNLTADHSSDQQGSHGTHVAGIAAANPLEDTTVVGMAPDAQIAVMKVFGANGGAYNDDIIAAIEDALILGCDVINLSLGSARGFTSTDPEIDAIYSRIKNYDVVVTISAGNEGSSSYDNMWGTDLNKTTDMDNATISSPSTYVNATSIASANNYAQFSTYLILGEENLAYSDAIGLYVTFADLGEGPFQYVMVPGMGEDADYEGLDVTGKIAVVSRGSINFSAKLANAETNGAMGLVVYNNEEGSIGMQMTDDEGYLADGISGMVPAVSVSMAAGKLLAEAQDKSFTLGSGMVETEDGGQMSSFSCWGVSPELRLLPDITGIGGNVYSTVDGGLYEMMSGTSMSAPQIAGISALMLEYLHERFPYMTDGEYHDVANAILMSTAQPVISTISGVEASPRQQGAGLANAYAALTAPGYLTVDNGRPKAELFDDPARTGTYTFDFDLNNITDKVQTYTLSGSILTEDATEVDGSLYMAGFDRSLAGDISFSSSTVTVRPGSAARVEVTVTLAPEGMAWLDENYANGGYVEGFIYAENEDGVVLSLPYLGFYGDWTDAPIFDTAFWYDDCFWTDEAEPTGAEYWNVLWTNLGGTASVLGLNPYTGDPGDGLKEEHFVLSNNADGILDNLDEIYFSTMRNARNIYISYTDAVTGEVYGSDVLEYIPKTMYMSNYGQVVPNIYSWYSDYQYDFTDAQGNPLPNGTKVIMTAHAELDFDRHVQTDRGDSLSFPIILDTEAPVLKDMQERTGAEGSFIDLTFTDNVAPAAVYVLNSTGTRILGSWAEFTQNEDGSYAITLDVSGLGTELQLVLCDYAANEHSYALEYTLHDNRPAVDTDALYAYRLHDSSFMDESFYGWVTLNTEDLTATAQTTDILEYYAINAAEYAGGYIFAVDAGNNLVALVPGLWNRIDICTLDYTISDMAFDETTNTMYAVGRDDYGAYLLTLDLITGEVAEVASYRSIYYAPWAFTIDSSGTFWCIKQRDAVLYNLDESYALVPVNDAEGNPLTLYTPDGDTAYPNYSQSMTYNKADGCIYWAYCTYSYWGASCLYTINTDTLEYTAAPFANSEEFVGLLYIDDSMTDYTCDGTNCPSAHFTDLDLTSWYHEGVDYVVSTGTMEGVSETLFAPNGTVTRAQLVTVLHRMAGTPAPAGEAAFADVPEDAWFAEAVAWAKGAGVANGITENLFAPNEPLTREQLATFLYRYVRLMGYETGDLFDKLTGFTDGDTVSTYARAAMEWAVGEGLINGVRADLLAPRGSATRAQLATILLRLYENVLGAYSIPASQLSGLSLPESELLMVAGSRSQTNLRPYPWNARLGDVTWTSSDEAVATVDGSGLITALSEGDVVITATCGELTASIQVRVVELRGTVYAYNYYSNLPTYEDWISFEVGNIAGGLTSYGESPVDFLSASYNGHDGWIYGYVEGGQFYRYSMQTGECSALGAADSSRNVMDMAYDYSTGFMYALTLDAATYTSQICYVNLVSGELVPLGMAYNAYLALACSTEGQLYAVTADGFLMEITVDEGMIMENPLTDSMGSAYYQQSMTYDHNNDVIIWAFADSSVVVWIDPATGDVIYLGDPTGSGAFEFTGMFTIPETIEPLPYVAVEYAEAQDIVAVMGAKKFPNASVYPLNATNRDITWVSSDPAIVTVNEDGSFQGVAVGSARLDGTLVDGDNTITLSFNVDVLASADNMYGHVLTDFATMASSFWAEISDTNPGELYPVNSTMYTLFAEEYHDGKVYAYGYDAADWEANWQFMVLDAQSFELLEMTDLGEEFRYFVYDMTYDYTTSTMYAVAGPSEATDLFIVNTNNGDLIPCMTLNGNSILGLAAAPDGTLYAMENSISQYDPMTWSETYSNATLYTLDVENGTMNYFGDTGVRCNLVASMAFDHDSGNLYWPALFRQDFYSPVTGGLHVIDVSKGATAVNLGNIGASGAQVSGLMIYADNYPQEPEPTLQKVMLDQSRAVLGLEQSVTLEATVMPVTLQDYTLDWSSSDETVVTVSPDGTMTGVASGTAAVTVTVNWNGQSAEAQCLVTVLSADAGYMVYNHTLSGWTKLNRGDVSDHSQVAADTEGSPAVLIADYAGDTIYGYDANGSFFSADGEFNRTVIGENVLDLSIDPATGLMLQLRDMGYNAATGELLVLAATVMASYDDYSQEWYYDELYNNNRIYKVDMQTGEMTEVCLIDGLYYVRGLTVTDEGVVWIYTPFDDSFNTVDLTTGMATSRISLQSVSMYGDTESNQYMDYDPASGNLCLSFTSNGRYRQLVTVNAQTLIITNLGKMGNAVLNEDTWQYDSDNYGCLLVRN